MTLTLFWHDYETWGANPARDKPSQFAGIRTDEALNVIGEPVSFYCRPASDCLPSPTACLVTGITPQQAQKNGLPDNQFMAAVHKELSRPGTCGVGYNTIRFDDEVTRYGLFRNFYDPYEREWSNGNSRWDIIDMVRMCHALRPEGIEWPSRDDGTPSFKLEHLSAANQLAHESAHDALSDVHATIALARLIREKQPDLYDYAFRMRLKNQVAGLIDLQSRKPLLHISSKYPAARGCAALVVPLAMHPVNKNAVIVFDLSADPSLLLDLDAETIAERVFTRQEDLEEGSERVPLKAVHLNKSPMLATPKIIDRAAERRLGIDKTLCDKHWQQLASADIEQKVQTVFTLTRFPPASDPEQQLYDGFLDKRDKNTMAAVRKAGAGELASTSFSFHDARLPELLFRYRARNFPDSLTTEEQQQWREFVHQRLTDPAAGASLTVLEFREQLAVLEEGGKLTDAQRSIIDALRQYEQALTASLNNAT